MDQMIPVTHVQPHVPWSGAASLITPEPWMQESACAEVMPDMFFPQKGHGESSTAAKKVCGGCPVIADCLGYALRTDQRYGVWGGQSERELRKLRKAARA
jgi:WhiB family redox-sensing transcriptional regulator